MIDRCEALIDRWAALIDRRADCKTNSKIARQMAGSRIEEQLAGLTGRLLDRQADCYRKADRIPVICAE